MIDPHGFRNLFGTLATIAVVAVALSLTACGDQSSQTVLTVAPYKVPCGGSECMMVAQDRGQAVPFQPEIAGFQFRWGVAQTVRVRVVRDESILESSSVHYELIDTVSRAVESLPLRFDADIAPGVATMLSGDTLKIQGYPTPITGVSADGIDVLALRAEKDWLRLEVDLMPSGVLRFSSVTKTPFRM